VGEVHAFEPNYEGSTVIEGPAGAVSSAKGSHRFEARAGHHLAPAKLASGRNVYEALGAGYTLLALGASPLAAKSFNDAASELRLPLTIVEEPAAGEADRYEASLVLVRPDQFVAWTARQSEVTVEEALRVLRLSRGT
jgi:hypothetical protein